MESLGSSSFKETKFQIPPSMRGSANESRKKRRRLREHSGVKNPFDRLTEGKGLGGRGSMPGALRALLEGRDVLRGEGTESAKGEDHPGTE